MRKLSYIIITAVMFSNLLTPLSATDYHKDISRPSGTSIAKTLFTGILLMSSPAAIMAQESDPSTFVGCYKGQISPSPVQFSNNLNFSNLYPINCNNNFDSYAYALKNPYYMYFSDNINNNPTKSSLNIKIECVIEDKCNTVYLKKINFCKNIFDVNYYANILFTSVVSNTGTIYNYNFLLSVWKSLPSLNNTDFEKIFNTYKNTKGCPPNSITLD